MASPRRTAKRELNNSNLGNVTLRFGSGATFVLLVSKTTYGSSFILHHAASDASPNTWISAAVIVFP